MKTFTAYIVQTAPIEPLPKADVISELDLREFTFGDDHTVHTWESLEEELDMALAEMCGIENIVIEAAEAIIANLEQVISMVQDYGYKVEVLG